jgi:UDP-GlcNAc:undecaprenyl-phosphate GlcNAc-1-phosphate transferase
MAIAVSALVLAFLFSYGLTPLIRRLALRCDFIDRPDGQRKIQTIPVALGGGIGLLIVTPLVVWLITIWWGPDLWFTATSPASLFGLAAGACILGLVGLFDDGYGMRGSYKLLWQVLATSVVMGAGFKIPNLMFLNIEIPMGYLGSAFTVVWLLGAINSFNLIDGVDGLAGSLGVIFSLTLGCMALLNGQYLDAVIAFALAGALLGFLRFNFPPASIYLGDTGSMFIGVVLGTIALRCTMKQAATLAFAAPLAVWAIPMFDSMAAVLRRWLTGRSIYATDRGHIHHVLLTHGCSATQAVGLISALCLVTSVGALGSIYYDNEWIGIGAVLVVIGILMLTRIFGHVELLLLNTRLVGFGRMISPFLAGQAGDVRQTSLNLQGSRRWEDLWGALVESADRFHVVRMRLNLSLPKLHEDFYATWQRSGNHRRELCWQTDIPLMAEGQSIGRLCVTGQQSTGTASVEVSEFIDFVEGLESQLQKLIQQDLRDMAARPALSATGESEAESESEVAAVGDSLSNA